MAINIKNKPVRKKSNPYGEPAKIEEPRVLNIVDETKKEIEKEVELTKQLSINLSPDEHFAFKAYAMMECRKSMKDVFLEAWELHKEHYKK